MRAGPNKESRLRGLHELAWPRVQYLWQEDLGELITRALEEGRGEPAKESLLFIILLHLKQSHYNNIFVLHKNIISFVIVFSCNFCSRWNRGNTIGHKAMLQTFAWAKSVKKMASHFILPLQYYYISVSRGHVQDISNLVTYFPIMNR